MLPKSIRWRIQAWYGLVLVSLVAALIIAFYAYERHQRYSELDSQLRDVVQEVLPRLTPMGGGMRPEHNPDRQSILDRENGRDGEPRDQRDRVRPPESASLNRFIANGVYYVGWSREGAQLGHSTNAPAVVVWPGESAQEKESSFRFREEFRELVHFTPRGEVILVGISIEATKARLQTFAATLVLIGVSLIAIGLGVGWWVASRALKPIQEIDATARQIAEGNFSKRIKITNMESELGQLAAALNQSFDQVEKSFDQQVRFTADASHELRTPLSVILTQIQLALSRERSPEEYRATLETCERAAERMRTLVNQLLDLARIDTGDATIMWERCDLGRISHDALDLIQPLALKRGVKLTNSIESISTKADPMKLGQVLINLLNNALVHNAEGIELCLTVQRKGEKAVIRVADSGGGIPAEALPQLFERFYRVDKARSRKKGSSGLGLAICKAIVDAHRGTINVKSTGGQGTEFTVELPVADVTLHSRL